ncbi:MAG: hypothetical protein M0Z91_09490 [Actinomycetota bacterium]|nr:hypothetical protein [Actinomycetota bacterium]
MRHKAPADRLIARYLATLDRELRALPHARRRQIVDEINRHITEARADLDRHDPVAIKALLERVGDPRSIAVEADPYAPEVRPNRWADRLVPWLLWLGGFIFGVGWLLGVVLLWASPTWRTRDKLLGTVVFPGGLATAFALLSLQALGASCTGSQHPGKRLVFHCTTSGFVLPFPVAILTLIVMVVAPIITVAHLDQTRRRRETDSRVPSNL